MTVEEQLKEQTEYLKRIYALLTEIKFELHNARVRADTTYKIKVGESWLDRIKEILKKF